MKLKEFLEKIDIDGELKVQYSSWDNGAEIVTVFDTGDEDSITEEELIKRYGEREINYIYADTKHRYYTNYPQLVIEIEEE